MLEDERKKLRSRRRSQLKSPRGCGSAQAAVTVTVTVWLWIGAGRRREVPLGPCPHLQWVPASACLVSGEVPSRSRPWHTGAPVGGFPHWTQPGGPGGRGLASCSLSGLRLLTVTDGQKPQSRIIPPGRPLLFVPVAFVGGLQRHVYKYGSAYMYTRGHFYWRTGSELTVPATAA
jgi:hypothetical protein